MKRPTAGFNLEAFVTSIEKKGVEKTLVNAAKDLLLLTWKAAQTNPQEKKP